MVDTQALTVDMSSAVARPHMVIRRVCLFYDPRQEAQVNSEIERLVGHLGGPSTRILSDGVDTRWESSQFDLHYLPDALAISSRCRAVGKRPYFAVQIHGYNGLAVNNHLLALRSICNALQETPPQSFNLAE